MPLVPWLLAVCFCFLNVSACAGSLVSGCLFLLAFFTSLAGLVPPFGPLGDDFRSLGGTLGGRGSSRRDTLGSGVGFSTILDGFWDPKLRASLAIRSNIGVFLLCLFQFFFTQSGLNLVGWSLKQAFGASGCAKTTFPKCRDC